MTIATYTDLQAAVVRWLHRSDLAPVIPDLIALGEADLRRRLRTRLNTLRSATTLATEYTALPCDFRGLRTLVVEGLELEMLEPETMAARAWPYSAEQPAKPRHMAIIGQELRLHPVPDRAYAAELVYFSALPALSNSAPTNWLLTSHPDAYLFAALANSAPYLRDDARLPMWSQALTGAIAAIVQDDAESLESASRAPLRTDVPRHHHFGGLR